MVSYLYDWIVYFKCNEKCPCARSVFVSMPCTRIDGSRYQHQAGGIVWALLLWEMDHNDHHVIHVTFWWRDGEPLRCRWVGRFAVGAERPERGWPRLIESKIQRIFPVGMQLLDTPNKGQRFVVSFDLSEQTVEQTIETPVIWDIIAFIMVSLQWNICRSEFNLVVQGYCMQFIITYLSWRLMCRTLSDCLL